ncbi:MAG: type II toxin-antitoxin system VapC family toxin [Wenzhouxiangella sp.]|nr:MAG: type II toxin-antitoxin system VapC family toxin [Wenzhouxiangella sp.]
MRYLLDSVIVIDHLNGIDAATDFLLCHSDLCALSVITRAEVLAGCADEQEATVTSLLSHFPTLPLTVDIGDLAARLRRSDRLKLPDAFQAAVAITHKLSLVTRNTRDFRPGGDLSVLIPYEL